MKTSLPRDAAIIPVGSLLFKMQHGCQGCDSCRPQMQTIHGGWRLTSPVVDELTVLHVETVVIMGGLQMSAYFLWKFLEGDLKFHLRIARVTCTSKVCTAGVLDLFMAAC